jgi:regulator of CtrA degradation
VADELAPTAFFNKTFDETYGLLVEARNYIAYDERGDRALMAPPDRLEMSREAMRLTTRLTHIMAWLLFQQAVFAGEISRPDAASDRYRLGGQSVCLSEGSRRIESFPQRFADLVERGRRLYVRVSRLDAMVARERV